MTELELEKTQDKEIEIIEVQELEASINAKIFFSKEIDDELNDIYKYKFYALDKDNAGAFFGNCYEMGNKKAYCRFKENTYMLTRVFPDYRSLIEEYIDDRTTTNINGKTVILVLNQFFFAINEKGNGLVSLFVLDKACDKDLATIENGVNDWKHSLAQVSI
jgi:hypothetical protein